MEGGEDGVRMARAEGEGKRTGANERLQLFEFLSLKNLWGNQADIN